MKIGTYAAWILVGLVLAFCAGCGGKAAEEVKEGADGVRDQVTGAAPIQHGRTMKKQLNGIEKKRQDQFKDAVDGE